MIARQLVDIRKVGTPQLVALPEGTSAVVFRPELATYTFYLDGQVQLPKDAVVWFLTRKVILEEGPKESVVGPFSIRYRIATSLNEEFALSLRRSGIEGLDLPASSKSLEEMRSAQVTIIQDRPPIELLLTQEFCQLARAYDELMEAVTVPKSAEEEFLLVQRVRQLQSRLETMADVAPLRAQAIGLPADPRNLFAFVIYPEKVSLRPEAHDTMNELLRKAEHAGAKGYERSREARTRAIEVLDGVRHDLMQSQRKMFESIAEAIPKGGGRGDDWMKEIFTKLQDATDTSLKRIDDLTSELIDLADKE